MLHCDRQITSLIFKLKHKKYFRCVPFALQKSSINSTNSKTRISNSNPNRISTRYFYWILEFIIWNFSTVITSP